MTLHNILFVMTQLALAATVAYDYDDLRPLSLADDDAFFQNAQALCLAKKSQAGAGLVEAQVNIAESWGTLGTLMKFDVDCARADNNYRDARVKSCIYDDPKFGRLTLPAHASSERVLNMEWSGYGFDIRIYCSVKGAASATQLSRSPDPLRQRGRGPIQSVKELCIVNRGLDAVWGVYDTVSHAIIPVRFKVKCDGYRQSEEIASCTAGSDAPTGGRAVTLNAGSGGTTTFWYKGPADNRPMQYTLSCDKSKGAAIAKTSVAGNAVAPYNRPSQHKAQALKPDENPTGSTFFRLDT